MKNGYLIFICFLWSTYISEHVYAQQQGTAKDGEGLSYSIKSETFVTSPIDRKRKRIGVGEDVKLTMQPEIDSTWQIKSGGGTISSTSGITVNFTAPENTQAGSETVILATSKNSGSAEITFTIVKPSGVVLEKTN